MYSYERGVAATAKGLESALQEVSSANFNDMIDFQL
jgi:hypothetical protein